MDSEPKKAEIEEEAILMEMEEAERQEIEDGMEFEEDETSSSREEEDDDKDDEAEREDALYNMFIEDLKYSDLVGREVKERVEVEDTDEDEEEDTDEDEDEDEFRKICNTKNWCGRA
jgi:hypothetical protein